MGREYLNIAVIVDYIEQAQIKRPQKQKSH